MSLGLPPSCLITESLRVQACVVEEEGKRERNGEKLNLLHPENLSVIYRSAADDDGLSEKRC